MNSILRNIKDGLGFLAFLLIILATTVWIAVAFQKSTLVTDGWPAWAILVISIATLLLTLLTYKDLGEVMTNGGKPETPKIYHVVFSALTVFSYGGAVLMHYSPVIAMPIIVSSFLGKIASKKYLRKSA